MILLTGTLLAQGRRTITAALRHTGNGMAGNWSSFHQVLNRARWSPLVENRERLLLIVETFVPAGVGVDLVIDETLERRWGSKISNSEGSLKESLLVPRERPGLAKMLVKTQHWRDWLTMRKRDHADRAAKHSLL